MRKTTVAPRIGVVMGSRSDWETMRHAAEMLTALGIEHEVEVVSAHRTPVQSRALKGLDSLLSIAQMPAGVPVGTLAIGEAGAKNAGLLAAAIVALHDAKVAQTLDRFRDDQTEEVLRHSDPRLTPPHPAPASASRKRSARP
jgi:5-(carboxyamino)imidazole ribonucleotide mutase